MADRVVPGPVDSSACVREAVCIHTKKIYSSCRDKDCVEDLRVFPTRTSQGYIENAFSIRPKSAELLYAGVNVEEITFNRGYYTVDVTYFYRVTGECVPNAKIVTGLCVFNKRVILFGSEGSVKDYTSDAEITTHADQPSHATASSASRNTTPASPTTNASARRTTIPARSSGASASRWKSFIRPTTSPRATATEACFSNHHRRKRRNRAGSDAFLFICPPPGG